MTDIKRTIQDDKGTRRSGDAGPAREEDRSRTEGTNRDFDESGTAANQGHSYSREERGQGGQSGVSDRAAREKVRGDEGVGGKVRRKDPK